MFAGSIGTRRYTLAFATFSFLIPVNRAITEAPCRRVERSLREQVSEEGRKIAAVGNGCIPCSMRGIISGTRRFLARRRPQNCSGRANKVIAFPWIARELY